MKQFFEPASKTGFRKLTTAEVCAVSGGNIIVTGTRPEEPDFGGLDPLFLHELQSAAAIQDAIKLLQDSQSMETAPPDDDHNGCNTPASLPPPEEDPSKVNPEHKEAFENNKSTLAASLFALGVTYSGSVSIGGNTHSLNVDSQEFGEFLDDYDFYWSDAFNSESGAGASLPDYAIVSTATLLNGAVSEDLIAMGALPANGDFGVAIWNWVTLHEAAHQFVIDSGIQEALRADWWNNGNPEMSWEDSPQFAANEQITNDLVRAMANSLPGVELPDDLRGGEGAMNVSTSSTQGTDAGSNDQSDEGDHCSQSE